MNNVYPATSPYYTSIIVEGKYLDVMSYRPIPTDNSDVKFTITAVYEYRPDLLAYDLYGDSRLWWVFAVRNPNTLGSDPYFDFSVGKTIYIPKLTAIQQALGI